MVSDSVNCRIHLFSPQGRSLKYIGTEGSGPQLFQYPFGIAIHPHCNKIYVADNNNHRIQVLNPGLTFCSSFIGQDTGNGQSSSPEDISFDSSGHVFVSDSGNRRIHVFTENVVYIRQFGQEAGAEWEMRGPVSIAIDSNDVVYVGGNGNNHISLFSRDGHFLRAFGVAGSGPGQFSIPHRIAISDCANKFVQMF